MIFFFIQDKFKGIAAATAKKLNTEERKIGLKLVWKISNLYTRQEVEKEGMGKKLYII